MWSVPVSFWLLESLENKKEFFLLCVCVYYIFINLSMDIWVISMFSLDILLFDYLIYSYNVF